MYRQEKPGCPGKAWDNSKVRIVPMILRSAAMIRNRTSGQSYIRTLHDICGRNAWVLFFLESQEKNGHMVFQKDIESCLSMTRSGVSKLIKGIEADGLIKRQAVPEDARLKRIVLTQRGRELTRLAQEEKERLDEDLCAGFSQEELEGFASYLERFMENMKAAPAAEREGRQDGHDKETV